MTAIRAARLVLRVLGVVALLFVGAWVVGCAPAPSLTHWPERDSLYRRYCAIEIDRGRLPFTEFEACVHRLTEHRGEACTHKAAGGAR